MPENSLLRFHEAQKDTFADALNEIRAGKKNSHWMWFIFPQLAGLGLSPISRHYAIRDLKEAESFLQDNVLAERLKTISKALMEVTGRSAREIFGSPDDLKLRSSMTLFSSVNGADPAFGQVLDKYFDGRKDERTLELLKKG